MFPYCSYFPEEFSLLITFKVGPRTSKRDECLLALIPMGTTDIRLGVRLYKGKLHVDYKDRLTNRRKVTEFKQMRIFDRSWHTVIITVSADRVTLRMDCGKRRTKRLKRIFPALINIQVDNFHIGNYNREKRGLFTVSVLGLEIF